MLSKYAVKAALTLELPVGETYMSPKCQLLEIIFEFVQWSFEMVSSDRDEIIFSARGEQSAEIIGPH